MNDEERWTLLASLMPEGIGVEINKSGAVISDGNKEVIAIYNDANNSYVINGTTFHFEDDDFEFLNTLLVPIILQELDGDRRIF